ncbi:TonB-dependent receptor [Cellvibrio sp. KB43]|uniref:TonB-dependent receptor n=2 Tax=Cellvibrio polysaccharolyticus TaxID=2082724 RepID=A0A928UYY5_9GAMM|nr:TonB-dependent receptor [Cellvibrio polysaccharolyticus]
MIQHKHAPVSHGTHHTKTFKKSLLALCIMSIGMPVLAQESNSGESSAVEEIVVTGMRQSLQSAQDIKRNAATVVESITAKDLGSFPDKSVAEALQRIPGITVNRFAASSDTTHFSAEPSGVLVRGLNQVRTEFNGRDSFSANSSRGLSWGDVSPELMAGVDTYKNQMAELIEGGIAGTVNMRTRVPFDQEGQMTALSVSGNYGDLSEKATPEVSGLYSNRWDTGIGEVGFLANLAYSEVQTRSEGNQVGRMNRFRNTYDDGGAELKYIPANFTFLDNLYERERLGGSLAFQWQDPNEEFTATLQYNRSEYENKWRERGVSITGADNSYGQSVYHEVGSGGPFAATGDDPFVFTPGGLFQSGRLTFDNEWVGNPAEEPINIHTTGINAAGERFLNPDGCYSWNCDTSGQGGKLGTFGRSANTKNMTQDLGFNFKWAPTDTMRANFDLQYIDSTVENYDINVAYTTFASAYADISNGRPVISLEESPNVNYSPGFLNNPNNYFIDHIMDHIEDSEGNQFSAKVDFEFDLDVPWAESIKAGARFADREQIVRWGNYNWNAVAPTWMNWVPRAAWANLDRGPDTEYGSGFKGYPQGHYAAGNFGTSFHNLSQSGFVFPNLDLLSDQQRMANTMGAAALGLAGNGAGGWDPICSNMGARGSEVPGTCYTPAEIADVVEETTAFYVQLNFGGSDAEVFGMNYSGNIGVRYVETDLTSSGGISLPVAFTSDQLECREQSRPPEIPAGQPYVPRSVGCYISADEIAFANAAAPISSAKVNYDNWLPSFNLKLEPVEGVVVRYAWSTAMARPDMGNLRNYVSVSKATPDSNDPNDSLWIKDSNGEITGAQVYYSGNAHNPYLKPIEAKQQDLSLEYYWSAVGSVSATIFEKNFDNYIQSGVYNREFTNNGVTRTAEISGPVNGDGAKLQGFELAFQTFFDFLPAPWDGFGVQANYTYIDNKGITNTNINNNAPGGAGTDTDGQAPDYIQVNALEGLSKDSYNIIGMYEKGDVALRVAYSWRSEYMVTARDCCVVYPVWNEAQGHLDASIRYNITDNIELSLQGSNLLNTTTKLRQQVTDADDGALKLPNSWFQNDRRFTLGVRFQY